MPDTPEHKLPLHLAVDHGANVSIVHELYTSFPDAVKCHTNSHGMIPLHFAVNHKKADIDTVQFLLEKYKAGAEARTRGCKSLPLHLAARYGCPMDVIQVLVDAYPQSLRERNLHGETPFHNTYTGEKPNKASTKEEPVMNPQSFQKDLQHLNLHRRSKTTF
ncbi:hypothetical protein CTEN210_08376 [Chaetoceros tenuissimus]|uniref:Uncharacterized protein n=1 Tax=Chaetoceros tenuissimus TaxID=426638 RepID=A0AAD3CVV6_9STRA|nr:hypothetical protein CTEN210_08376 [Chaetoceros tenuissimus]